jgi:hypothetical protein
MTKEEISQAIDDLKIAMLEMVDISQKEENIKVEKQRVQKKLSLARELVRSIEF